MRGVGVVDSAIYVDGRRRTVPTSLDQTYEALRACGGLAWIGMYRPSPVELRSVAGEFGLHSLVVEDTIKAHQRPKLERYGDVLFTVLRSARYVDAEERVEFGEVHIITGKDFVVTVRYAESPDLARVRSRLETDPALLALGPEAVLYAVVDQVVDEYVPVLAGLQNDVDEIEDQVFDGDPEVSRRIYELLREVVELQRATHPLLEMHAYLEAGFEKYGVDLELRRYLRDVDDHVVRVVERVDGFRVLLQNILTVNATLVGQRQNEETQRLTEASLSQGEQVKRISSWAAILFAPALVGTVYGMNFRFMPELEWRYGYPMALAMMLVSGAVLFGVFKRKSWL